MTRIADLIDIGSDPLDAPLVKVQLVKDWMEIGEAREEGLDILCSEGQSINPETRRCSVSSVWVNRNSCAIDQTRRTVSRQQSP